jgi:hypothetical protein
MDKVSPTVFHVRFRNPKNTSAIQAKEYQVAVWLRVLWRCRLFWGSCLPSMRKFVQIGQENTHHVTAERQIRAVHLSTFQRSNNPIIIISLL